MNPDRREDIFDRELERRVEALSREAGVAPAELLRDAIEQYSTSLNRPARDRRETPLGRKLREIRRRIVRSGAKLFDADALMREVAERRGDRSAE